MDNSGFWSTIGQVSGTFAGLVFVAVQVYLGNVRVATKELVGRYPMQEISSRIVSYSILSSMILLSLPLLIALVELGIHSTVPQSLSIGGVLLVAVCALQLNVRRRAGIRAEINKLQVPINTNTHRMVRARLHAAEISLIASIWVLLLFLGQAIPNLIPASTVILDLEITAIGCLSVGLAISVVDLFLFDTGNIEFRLERKGFLLLARNYDRDLNARLRRLEVKLRDLKVCWEKVVSSDLVQRIEKHGNMQGENVIGQIAGGIDAVDRILCTLKASITDPEVGFYLSRIRTLGHIATLQQINQIGIEALEINRLIDSHVGWVERVLKDLEYEASNQNQALIMTLSESRS